MADLYPLKMPRAGIKFSRTKQFETIHGDPDVEFTKQVAARFGQKYQDIVRKYGAVEYITNDNDEIIDVMAPEEYLNESDDFAIARFISGDHTSERYSITAAALKRLAEAECQFWATQYLQLRNEPEYLRQQVESEARTRPELVPDGQGNAPTPEQLLNIPRYVGQQTRYVIHNVLMHLGTWRVVAEYLNDIANLDEKEGRFGAKARREELMACVKSLIEQEIGTVSKRVLFGLMFHPESRVSFIREFNHEDWGGARFTTDLDGTKEVVVKEYLAQNLIGALMRFGNADPLRHVGSPMTPRELRMDLLHWFSIASQTELDGLTDQLYGALSEMQRLHDFGEMLAHPQEVGIPGDDRYVSFAMAGRQTEAILKKALFEKHIKSIESLGKRTVFGKIWKDVDACFQKAAQKHIEQIIGFVPPGPRWFSPAPTSVPEPQSAPPPTAEEPSVDETSAEPTPKPRRRPPRPPPKPDPASANIKPYWSRAELPSVEVPAIRTGPKVKTRKAPLASTSATQSVENKDNVSPSTQKLPVFLVGKRVYNTFARLFSGGKEKGDLTFEEFQYAMTSNGVGFSLIPKRGSMVTFIAPVGKGGEKNKHFVCHRPHGQRDSLDNVRLREYAASLSESYGWTIGWFGLKADGLADE